MGDGTQGVGATVFTSLVAALLAAGCGGPTETPTQVVDLTENPTALEAAFDRRAGEPRLVLLLSPG